MALKTETNTPDMEREVRAAAATILDRSEMDLATFFEHGQWWVEIFSTGAQYSVCDAAAANDDDTDESKGIVNGFCLEQVTQGEED